jgi:hypothetical protein
MTTDLVPGLARDAEMVSRYWDALADPDAIDGYSWLVPENVLADLRREIEESLKRKPASRQEIAKAVAVIIGALKIPTNAIEDKEAFFRSMRSTLGSAGYPADTINEAVARACRTEHWTPSTAWLLETAEHLVEERRLRLRAVQRMEAEHRRRRQVATEREAEAERKAKREAEQDAHRQAELERLRSLEAQALERFGDDGLLRGGDVELAESLSPTRLYRAGRRVSWQAALAEGEPWAVQYCRQMALAARVRRAHERGQVSWDWALAVGKQIVTDEASARHQIDDMEGCAASYQDGKLTEGFWRAVWKIAGACGLDTPGFPHEAAAAAIENLKHFSWLAALEDTRTILDRQVVEEWKAQRAARNAQCKG